ACLWFIAKDRSGRPTRGGAQLRDRRNHILFISARELGFLVDRTHRELSGADRELITSTYHAWRGQPEAGEYSDVAGFCRSVGVEELRANGHLLTAGRYVGSPINNSRDHQSLLANLRQEVRTQLTQSEELTARVHEVLDRL